MAVVVVMSSGDVGGCNGVCGWDRSSGDSVGEACGGEAGGDAET